MKWICTSFLLLIACWISAGVMDDLEEAINDIASGETIEMTYYFVGCYGAYHKGEISLTKTNDSINYMHKSYHKELQKPFNQSGSLSIDVLRDQLDLAKKQSSSEVLGNQIHYTIVQDGKVLFKGNNTIEQRHFIEIFHPFGAFIQSPFSSKKVIKTPGIGFNPNR